jgi:hypothetical protein
LYVEEEFEDTKEAIRIRKSKKKIGTNTDVTPSKMSLGASALLKGTKSNLRSHMTNHARG